MVESSKKYKMEDQCISLEQRKQIQLEMLIEIDKFCRANNIKYMLAFGTLLGAIRHKGYIPWDDDVDISMPLDDMIKFKNEFKSDNLKYCDVDTENNYEWTFSRIVHKQTYNKTGITYKAYGVNIDLYPTIEVSSSPEENEHAIARLMKPYRQYCAAIKCRRRAIRVLPITTIPGFEKCVRKYRDLNHSTLYCKNGGAFHCDAGPLELFKLHTFAFNPFEDMIEVDFEGYKFMAPSRYDEYLTTRYGNYMKLPPEDQRHPYHGGKYYWKVNSKK